MLAIKLSFFKKFLYLLVFFLFIIISWRAFQSHIFNIHFVDEDENIIAGYYMTKGEKLYSDIFSHKQPLPAVVSMITQKLTSPNSLYLLIKRHREVIFFYSAAWSGVLIWQFGLPALFFAVIIEIAKPFLLGNLFLGESLAIFPAVYVIGFLWKHRQDFDKPPTAEKFLFSFSLVLLCLSLFALIPFAFFAFLALVLIIKKWKSYISLVLLSAGLGLFVTVFFVDYLKYLENTMVAIQTHYLGATTNEGLGKIILYSFFRPLTNLVVSRKGDFGNFIWSLSLVYLLSFTYLVILKKGLRKVLLISFFLLGISSLRYIQPWATFYNGFHGLPWFGLILWTTTFQVGEVLKDTTGVSFRRLKNLGLIIVVGFLLFQGRFFVDDYYRVTDRERDWYVNFSRFDGFGRTIKELSKKGDQLMVLPVEQLIYWQSGLEHATRFLYGYEWLFVNPSYRKEIIEELKKSPPAFIYYDRASMGKDAWSIFDDYVANYVRIKREDLETPLFVRKDRLNL
jgi:hypothetical protein